MTTTRNPVGSTGVRVYTLSLPCECAGTTDAAVRAPGPFNHPDWLFELKHSKTCSVWRCIREYPDQPRKTAKSRSRTHPLLPERSAGH